MLVAVRCRSSPARSNTKFETPSIRAPVSTTRLSLAVRITSVSLLTRLPLPIVMSLPASAVIEFSAETVEFVVIVRDPDWAARITNLPPATTELLWIRISSDAVPVTVVFASTVAVVSRRSPPWASKLTDSTVAIMLEPATITPLAAVKLRKVSAVTTELPVISTFTEAAPVTVVPAIKVEVVVSVRSPPSAARLTESVVAVMSELSKVTLPVPVTPTVVFAKIVARVSVRSPPPASRLIDSAVAVMFES